MGDLPCKSNKTLYHEACNHWFYTKLCHEQHVIKIMQLKQEKRIKLTEEAGVTENDAKISEKFCYAKKS